MALLNFLVKLTAYGDPSPTQNPTQRFVDWTRLLSGLQVGPAGSQSYVIPASSSLSIFSGIRPTTIDGTTVFSLFSVAALSPSRYRFQWDGGGTNPTLRTDRNLLWSSELATVNVLANQSATITVSGGLGHDFTGVQVGDNLYLPGPVTDDGSSPFSPLNQGFWLVIGILSSTEIVVTRLPGQPFSAANEAVTLSSAGFIQAYSAAGVQVGDSLNVSAGFSAPALQTYSVLAVTSTYVDVLSTIPLAENDNILPGAAGMIFYSQGKSLVYVEMDQQGLVQANGDSGTSQNLAPILAGDPTQPGLYLRRGLTYSLTLVNNAQVSANAVVITVD
jgi:hypothetical protein